MPRFRAFFTGAASRAVTSSLLRRITCPTRGSSRVLFLWFWDSPGLEGWKAPVAAWILIGLAIAGDRYYAIKGQPILRPAMVAAAWLGVTRYVYVEVDREWVSSFWAVSSFAFLAYGLGLRSRTAGLVALGGVLMASFFQVAHAYDVPAEALGMWSLIAGFMAPVAFWLVCERLYRFASTKFEFRLGMSPAGVFVGLAGALLVIMLERIPMLSEFYLTVSWPVLALALFGLSLGFHEKVYRYAGLLILLLASARVVVISTRVSSR